MNFACSYFAQRPLKNEVSGLCMNHYYHVINILMRSYCLLCFSNTFTYAVNCEIL